MPDATDFLHASRSPAGDVRLAARGAWTIANVAALQAAADGAKTRDGKGGTLDVAGITELDTYGAWLLEAVRRGPAAGTALELTGTPDKFRNLLAEISQVGLQPVSTARPGFFARTGAAMVAATARGLEDAGRLADTLGRIAAAFARGFVRPQTLRWTSITHQLDRVGLQAVPIIVLITFLIGAIIAQQGLFHFRRFGAEDYVVDLVGILVLREIGVLIVAIMVAGRSGSSYTAELGSMKMREEIDALRTMGLDPVEVLMLPRVLALVIALPMLTLIGSLSALYGGGLVAWLYGGMSPAIFLQRLHEAVSITHFQVGMLKAPFMALVISVVACSEGMKVKGSAESLGLQTTTSVVKAIFFVIVMDGLFAVFFASIGM